MTMTRPPTDDTGTRLRAALAHPDASTRLRSALAAGTRPDDAYVAALVERSGVEPDFFVRDMLTWALARHRPVVTVPLLVREVGAGATPRARSQALHTLSKIGAPESWDAVGDGVLADPDPEVARTAWRAAVILAPEARRDDIARILAGQLGRGDRDVRLSLSRALVALGEVAAPHIAGVAERGTGDARAHALATLRLIEDPDEAFDAAVSEATRVVALAAAPRVADDDDADR
jgi:hypothetical protein